MDRRTPVKYYISEFITCRELNMIVGELDTIYDGDSDEASCNDGHQKTCVWKRRLTGQQAVIVPNDLVHI